MEMKGYHAEHSEASAPILRDAQDDGKFGHHFAGPLSPHAAA
jgi:hypothetical protein